MDIRDNNLKWTDEAIKLDVEICNLLRPIYKKYKNTFKPEAIQYLVTNTICRIIAQDLIEEKSQRFRMWRKGKGV